MLNREVDVSKNICIQPIGKVSEKILKFLSEKISEKVGLHCAISKVRIQVPEKAFNSKRGQYYSTFLLYHLLKRDDISSFFKVLGVTDVDLYVPSLNFVFGEALLNGRVAIISLYRLKPEFYGKRHDEKLFLERALKEAVHEIGHTFGLTHCSNRKCVMYFSNSIYDTDYKTSDFCGKCKLKLKTY